jgi:hypothetical protein
MIKAESSCITLTFEDGTFSVIPHRCIDFITTTFDKIIDIEDEGESA